MWCANFSHVNAVPTVEALRIETSSATWQKVIGIDLDSTLINISVPTKAARQLGYDYTDKDVVDWDHKNFPDDMRARIFELYNDPKIMCEEAEPIKGSAQKIKEWTDRGYKIVIITARVAGIVKETIEMVNSMYPEIEDINFVNFNASKIDKFIDKKIDVWIDDASHGVIDAMSLHIPTVLISNKYTGYNWHVRNHPKLHHITKRVENISCNII